MTTRNPRTAAPGRWTLMDRLRRLHRCEGGQAIYVVVLYFFLLAGLVFLIINTGRKVNEKILVQGAADSVTATGAAWFARGLNVVSMCNVANTQLLSLIVLLDTLESVTPPAVECIDDLVQHIGQSKAGRDIPLCELWSGDPLWQWLVVGNAASEQVVIRQFADVVRAVQWPPYLRYDNGVLWECTKLMDGFSHTMRDVTPLAAQRESIDIARKNHAEFGFLAPLWPELPVEDGQFEDFKEPMRNARDPRTREIIGGFAWVMGYRGYRGQVLGPWGYWREPFTDARPMGLFDISRFSVLFRIVSDTKLEMMFGSTDDEVSLRAWVMDYDDAKIVPRQEIRRSWWERVGFDARFPENEEKRPFPPDGGAPPLRHEGGLLTPSTQSYRGSMGPDPAAQGYIRGNEAKEGADPRWAVWYRVTRRRTAHYPQLEIYAPHAPTYPDGRPWPYDEADMKTYWHVTLLRFNGLEKNTGNEKLHRDYLPPAGTPPDLAPILFDQQRGEHTVANVSEHFTFNGFAYRPGQVRDWGAKFVNPNPLDKLVCYAQARVYNRWSWDVFTQAWKVKMMRTDRWAALTAELARGVPAGAGSVGAELTDDRLDPVRKMLGAYQDGFVQEVTH